MWKAAASALILASGVAGPSAQSDTPLQLPEKSEILDYLIQDVCIDSAGRPIALDPAFCEAHRNVRIGERLPYLVTDFDRVASVSYASSSSIPVRGTDGLPKILVMKFLQGGFGPDYVFDFSLRRDSFDLIDASHSNYASIVRTFDGGCFDQLFSPRGRTDSMAARAGGWVLFPVEPPPSSWPPASSMHVATWRTQITPGLPQCADNHASGITFWYQPVRLQFESGKRLEAIRSDHFAASDLTQPLNSFERFYFTREYGMTRWESWTTVTHCRDSQPSNSPACRPKAPDNPLRRRCSGLFLAGPESGDLERWGGRDWVRIDCRDFTRFVALKRPQLPLSRDIATGGGMVDIDYDETVGAR